MKKLWKMVKNRRKDNRGLSLVELICTVAIFSVVATAVGGVMVVSAQNYQRGSNEINLQQEAQITVNQIADLVIDSTAEVTYTGTPEAPGADGTLQVKQGDHMYEVTFQAATQELRYSEYIVGSDGTITDTLVSGELMAENITDFRADASQFGQSGILKLKIGLAKSDRTYASDFTITSRNGGRTITSTDSTVTISTDAELVMEPNQEHLLAATVHGSSDTGVNWVLAGNVSSATQIIGTPTGPVLHVGTDETASELTLLAQSNVKREDGVTPMAQQTVIVHIRRVTAVNLTATLESGSALQSGAVYRISADVLGNNLDKFAGLAMDDDYVDPRKITWDYVYTKDGYEIGGEHWPYESPSSYFSVLDEGDTYTKIKLNQNITNNLQLLITAVAKHPEGVAGTPSVASNKTGIAYDHVYATHLLYYNYFSFDGSKVYRGSDTSQGSFNIDIVKGMCEAKLGNGSYQCAKYYRYREIISIDPVTGARTYGPWTVWAPCPLDFGNNDINLRPVVTKRFECNKDYEVQIKMQMYKGTESDVVWPFVDTPQSAYMIDAEVLHVRLYYNSYMFPEIANCEGAGSLDNPFVINMGGSSEYVANMLQLVRNDNNVLGIKFDDIQNKLQWTIQEYVDGSWVTVDSSVANIENQCDLQVRWRKTGTYRALIELKGVEYSIYNPSTNSYSSVSRDYQMWDETTGAGIFYFKVQ